MATDMLVSLGVVGSGIAIIFTGWLWLDAATSAVVAIIMVGATWGLFKDSLNLALHAVPAHINAQEVKTYLQSLPGVREAHDLHIWAMSTSEVALSAHLLMPEGHPGDAFFNALADMLKSRFHIGHSTIQVELGDDAARVALPGTMEFNNIRYRERGEAEFRDLQAGFFLQEIPALARARAG